MATNRVKDFPQKVEEVKNPTQNNWQQQMAKLAMFSKLNPAGQFGYIIGQKLLNPLLSNWLEKVFPYPKDKSNETTGNVPSDSAFYNRGLTGTIAGNVLGEMAGVPHATAENIQAGIVGLPMPEKLLEGLQNKYSSGGLG